MSPKGRRQPSEDACDGVMMSIFFVLQCGCCVLFGVLSFLISFQIITFLIYVVIIELWGW